MARKRQARRCRAHNRRGAPCGNFAVLGADVCRMHGGAATQVRRAARHALANDGAERLLGSMHTRNGELVLDGRFGPRRGDWYGYLPPSRGERERDERAHAAWLAASADPVRSAIRDFVIEMAPAWARRGLRAGVAGK